MNVPPPFPDARHIFFKALSYPPFARPEFYIKEQIKSGWSKTVFLQILLYAHSHYDAKLSIHISKEQRKYEKAGHQVPDDIGFDLCTETNGDQKGKFTKKELRELLYAIHHCYKMDVPRPSYDGYEIIGLCERMLLFIRGQYEEQVVKTSAARQFAERHKERLPKQSQPDYLLYHYDIISDAPVLDYPIFRNEIRKLLLTARNPQKLKIILKPLFDLCLHLIDLWNKQLSFLDQPSRKEDRGKAVRDQRLISVEGKTQTVSFVLQDTEEDFYRPPSKHYWNRDFAVFASRVANLISAEVLEEKKEYRVNQPKYGDFDQLFHDQKVKADCYQLLIQETIIDKDHNYTGTLKSALCIWVSELTRAKIIAHLPDKMYNELLNKKIKGLHLSDANYRKPSPKATRLYQPTFRAALSRLSRAGT